MLERFKRLLSTADETTITVSNSSKTESPGLRKFVTYLVAGVMAFNAIATYGAVIAGDYIAHQETAGYSQQYDEKVGTLYEVIDTYSSTLNTDTSSVSKPVVNINISATNITSSQTDIHRLSSGVGVLLSDLKGSYAEYSSSTVRSITIDMHQLSEIFKGISPDFVVLHEIGHSLMTYSNINHYIAMRDVTIPALGSKIGSGLVSVYAESHADAYAILKIAQLKGIDTALRIAHQVYEVRQNNGDFDKLSTISQSHDTKYALDHVTDYLIDNPNLDKLSNTDIYKTSLDLSIKSMGHWASKNNIQIPTKLNIELTDLANDSFKNMLTQKVDLNFTGAATAQEYMAKFTSIVLNNLDKSVGVTHTSEFGHNKNMVMDSYNTYSEQSPSI